MSATAATPHAQAEVRRELLSALVRQKTFLLGAAIVLFWIVCAILGYRIAPHDPQLQELLNKRKPPSGERWFGTDTLGRDVFSRILVGSRDVLVIATAATLLGTIVGTALGLLTGYFRGLFDEVVSRILEAIMSLPFIVVALLCVVVLGPSTPSLIGVVAFIFAPLIARTVRAAVVAERDLDYVAAARLRGEPATYILFAEILPNVLPPVIVEFTVRLGYAIFAVATLAFLGFSRSPDSPDWGIQIADSYSQISGGIWWMALFPALAIASLIVAVNLVSDGISQVLER